MDPNETPQVPQNEPTPQSPAPTQTSPVTPGTSTPQPVTPAGSAPVVPQDPTQAPAPAPLEPTPTGKGSKKWIAAIVAAVVAVAGLIFLLLSPWSPFVGAVPKGPEIMVGSNRYVNSCSVVDTGLVAKQMGVKSDVNKEGAEEVGPFAPANKDKTLDILKQSDAESVTSSCTVKLDRIVEGSGKDQKVSFINVVAAIEQFADEKKASDAFNSDKEAGGTSTKEPKQLSSYRDNSFYYAPTISSRNPVLTLKPEILYKNMLITISAPAGDGTDDKTGEKTAAKLDVIAKDIISHIENKEGNNPKNYNAINKIGGHKFVDACHSVNYVKVATALGNNTELFDKVASQEQAYAPSDNAGKTPNQIISNCTFSFRTQTEIDSAKDVKPDSLGGEKLTYSDKFPHYLTLEIAATQNKDDAQKFLQNAKDQTEANAKKNQNENTTIKVEDAQLGDKALKISLDRKVPAEQNTSGVEASTTGRLYYVTKGSYVYIISATYTQQDEPIKSQSRELTADQAKQIFKEMSLATRRAN